MSAPISSSDHKTGTREEWLAARLELLKVEKELTRRSDELARDSDNGDYRGRCVQGAVDK